MMYCPEKNEHVFYDDTIKMGDNSFFWARKADKEFVKDIIKSNGEEHPAIEGDSIPGFIFGREVKIWL